MHAYIKLCHIYIYMIKQKYTEWIVWVCVFESVLHSEINVLLYQMHQFYTHFSGEQHSWFICVHRHGINVEYVAI